MVLPSVNTVEGCGLKSFLYKHESVKWCFVFKIVIYIYFTVKHTSASLALNEVCIYFK